MINRDIDEGPRQGVGPRVGCEGLQGTAGWDEMVSFGLFRPLCMQNTGALAHWRTWA